jgi:hypothetical protein
MIVRPHLALRHTQRLGQDSRMNLVLTMEDYVMTSVWAQKTEIVEQQVKM